VFYVPTRPWPLQPHVALGWWHVQVTENGNVPDSSVWRPVILGLG